MNGIEVLANLGIQALLPLAVLYLAICVTATVILDRGLLEHGCALSRGFNLFALATGKTEEPVADHAQKVRLNIGCGEDYRPGFINTDWSHNVKAEKHFDLSVFPWPFDDNSADEVHMIDVLEHTFDSHRGICEVHRILKPGGLFVCHVPYAKSDGAFQAIEHKSYYTEKSFDYYCDPNKYPSYTGPSFQMVSVKLDVARNTKLARLRNLIPFRSVLRFFLWNMFDEVKFVLRKVA
jgi:predicted SAM-dependent methyltransferase